MTTTLPDTPHSVPADTPLALTLTKGLGPLLRGAAMNNDAMHEGRAEAMCSMGVGCGTAGACYAERMGRPDMCGRRA